MKRTVRWLAWSVGILFLLGTVLQLVDMQNLYAKLGAHSRLDVVRFAAKHGLVELNGEDQPG